MSEKPQNVVVIIADTNFVIPVYVLVLSLKKFQPEQKIHILGISLSEEEKSLFTQFNQVLVFDASIERSETPGAMRVIADILKGEALLTAKDCEEPWVALLDGDCVATGDITPYLQPENPGLYVRERSPDEDNRIFLYYRQPSDLPNGIPSSFIETWKKDVGELDQPARTTTVLSGNLIIHRDFLDFSRDWKNFMERTLSYDNPENNPVAYYMPAEFSLSAQLTFGKNPPPVFPVQLDSNPNAYLAHLGPSPRYWHFWRRKNLIHFDQVTTLLSEARTNNYQTPVLPYSLKKRNKLMITTLAWIYEMAFYIRKKIKMLHKLICGNSIRKQAEKYTKKTW